MTDYRHCTNLMTPFDPVDMAFLQVLGDYRLGDPVPASARDGATPRSVKDMKADGVVGLYTTLERLKDPAVMARTGWGKPEKVLGKALAA